VSETSVKARFENYKSRVSESRDEQQDEKGKHWRHGLPLQRMGKMTSPGKRPLLYPERGFNSKTLSQTAIWIAVSLMIFYFLFGTNECLL
jgi:hypothetical protein